MTFNTRPFIWGFQANCFTISIRLQGVHASAARLKPRTCRGPRGTCCFVLSELNDTTSAGSAPSSATPSLHQSLPSRGESMAIDASMRHALCARQRQQITSSPLTLCWRFTVSSLKDNCRRRRMGEWWKSARIFGARTCWEPGTSCAGCSPPCHKFPGF